VSDATLAAALRALRRLTAPPPDAACPPDAALVGRLARHRDRGAFEELVRRHGPLIWRVCRRLLPDPGRAEDAFQATFLLLARQAHAIRRPASVAGWLHGAAYRLASRARADLRRAPAALGAEPAGPAPDPAREAAWRELGMLVEEAVAALPERLRLPVLLCYWEGLTNEEAARRLGWPAGTVKGRLARARRALHRRLAALGVALPVGVAALLLAPGADAAVPLGLPAATSRRAAALWGGLARVALAGAARKWQLAAVLALALGAGGWAAAVLASRAPQGEPPPAGRAADAGPHAARPARPGTDLLGDLLPPGAVARLGTVGLRLPNAAGVGFRPTGELVGFSSDLALHVWPADAAAGPRVTAVTGERQYGWRRALSPDARFAAGLLPRRVVVWDVSGARPTEHTSRAVNDVYQMAFSANGAWLAVNETGGPDGALVLCDLAARTWSHIAADLRFRHVESLSFTPDGKWLAVVTFMDMLVVETAAARVRCRLSVPKVRPAFAALSPDGGTLAVLPMAFIHGAQPAVRLLAVPSGEEVAGLRPPTGPGRWVGFSPDGKALLVGGPRGIREWDLAAGKPAREIAGPAESPAVYSADGRRLAAHGSSAVLLWDVARGRHVRPDLAGAGHTEAILGVTVSPDGRLIATNALDGEIRVWAAGTGRPLCRAASTWGNDRRVAFLPDSKAFVAVAEDYVTPVVRDAFTGRELRRFEVPPEVARRETTHELRLTDGGKTLTAVSLPNSAGGKVYAVRWDVGTGRLLGRAELPDSLRELELLPTMISPDGRWVVKAGTLSRVGGGESVQLVPAGEVFFMLAGRFSDDGRLVAVPREPRGPGGADRASLVVFDVEARARLAELPTGQVLRLAFSPDGRLVAGGGREEVVLWEVLTGKPARRLPARHGATIRPGAIAFTPDGRRLVNGQDDCTALVWDLTGTGRAGGTPAPPLAAAALAGLWEDLAGPDAGRAETAGWELADRPAQAVALIRERVKPVRAADGAEVRALVARLDAAGFTDRQAAEERLRSLGEAAVPALREARAGRLSVEQKARVGRLLAAAAAPAAPAGARLRELRAVAVLERAGTAGAKEALEALAAGLAEARLTREAKAALRRLAGRPASGG
jgi:RNA polymerase sigma factor (sigma-70 family)